MKVLIFILGIFVSFGALATGGDKLAKTKLQGKVLDVDNYEYLVGASVRIPELNLQTFCNLDGEFEFANLPVGVYSLEIKLVSYTKTTFTEVEVSEKQRRHKFALQAL